MSDRGARTIATMTSLILIVVVVVGMVTGTPRPADRSSQLAARLRCPVCQGESIAASPSTAAIAMREQVDEMLAEGLRDDQILDHFTDRYGTWILLSPPASGPTLILWLLPLGAAIAGVAVVISRRDRGTRRTITVNPEERAAMEAAVDGLRRDEQRGRA